MLNACRVDVLQALADEYELLPETIPAVTSVGTNSAESLRSHLPRLMITVPLVLFGLQLLMFGVLAEVLTNLYYREEAPYRVASVVGEGGQRDRPRSGGTTPEADA